MTVDESLENLQAPISPAPEQHNTASDLTPTERVKGEVQEKQADESEGGRIQVQLRIPIYKNENNFKTWSSRFKDIFKLVEIPNNVFDLAMYSVDEITKFMLESVAKELTEEEKSDPEVFMPKLEDCIYPNYELRSLRLTLARSLVRRCDVDTFAYKIREMADQAYNDSELREEACLCAFLNGMRNDVLYDKILTVPGATENFEVAVSVARMFEEKSIQEKTPGLNEKEDEKKKKDSAEDSEEDEERSWKIQFTVILGSGTGFVLPIDLESYRYEYGGSFKTWTSRFMLLSDLGKLKGNQLELALYLLDDRTRSTLKPVVDKLTDTERQDPKLFLRKFKDAIYPIWMKRELRLLLTNGSLRQGSTEDMRHFEWRIRDIGRIAYRRSEFALNEKACLHAFLNGIYDREIFQNLVIEAPEAAEVFSLAVSTARRYEDVRKIVYGEDRQQGNRANSNRADPNRANSNRADPNRADPNRRKNRNHKKPPTCYQCGVVGHVARRCNNN